MVPCFMLCASRVAARRGRRSEVVVHGLRDRQPLTPSVCTGRQTDEWDNFSPIRLSVSSTEGTINRQTDGIHFLQFFCPAIKIETPV